MKTKNLKFWQVALFLFATTLLGTSCEKDEPKKKRPEIFQHNIKDHSKWYYYSFKTKQFVGTGDTDPAKGDDAKWAERTDWDIAFHRYDVRTNGGTSGKGQGGILELKTTKYFSVKEVGNQPFTKDEIVKDGIYLGDPHKQKRIDSSISSIACEWIKFDHPKMAWVITKRNVFIVKTAEGKFVKIQFVNFLNDVNKSGYLTMRYAYLNK